MRKLYLLVLLLLWLVGSFTSPRGRQGGAFAQNTLYIVKGGPDTGKFTGGVFIGLGSKINHPPNQSNVLVDEKIGITEGSWKDITGCMQNITGITKTSGNGWGNAGAASNTTLDTLENGWVQYTVSNSANNIAFGFSAINTDANYNSINYAVMLNADQLNG